MNILTFLNQNTKSLLGKTVAISGSTGGIGKELCFYLARLGAKLILLDRNIAKQNGLIKALNEKFNNLTTYTIPLDLSDMATVKSACEQLKDLSPDYIILNAGAYSVPRFKCSTGLDNVFQINFAAPYYIVKKLLPTLNKNGGRVVAVSSIAHNYSVTDRDDIDFSRRERASLVYGNAKRFLTFALYGLFENNDGATLAITHPGITLTGITAHYPKMVFALIKYPMKIIFHSPKRAALSVLQGLFNETEKGTWIGPKYFNIWGYPKAKKLKTCSDDEAGWIYKKAEEIYNKM